MTIQSNHPAMGQCPDCGGNIIEGKRGYGCSNWKKENGGCKFVIWKIISGKLILPQMLSKLLTDKQIGPLTGFRSEHDEEYSGMLRLVKEDNGWQIQVELTEKTPVRNYSDHAVRHSAQSEAAEDALESASPSIELGKCPLCGGEVVERSKMYGCSNWESQNCPFIIWKTVAGKELTPHMVQRLIAGEKVGPIDGFISKKGNPFSAHLILVQDENGNQRVRFDFPDGSEVIGKCPACGGNVVENNKGYGCANWKEEDGGCKFVIWKTVAQKELSKKVAIQLLENGSTDILFGFISRKGNAFSAKLKLEQDDSGKFKVVFDFSDDISMN